MIVGGATRPQDSINTEHSTLMTTSSISHSQRQEKDKTRKEKRVHWTGNNTTSTNATSLQGNFIFVPSRFTKAEDIQSN